MHRTARRTVRRASVAATAAVGLLVAWVAGAAQAADGSATATALSAELTSSDGRVHVGVGQARFPGFASTATTDNVLISGVGSARGARATAGGDQAAGTVRAAARVDALDLRIGDARLRTGPVTASCTAAPVVPAAGGSGVRGGTFMPASGGAPVPLPADAAPGTVVELPDGVGRVVLGERSRAADGTLTITALRLELDRGTGRYGGQLTAATVRCAAGEADPARITVAAQDAAGRPVADVGFEAARAADGLLVTDCVTDHTGRCDLYELGPDRHRVCVTAVPDGTRPPARPCRTVRVEAGERATLEPFTLR
ncbi:hypothetical protein JJV70_17025 [Streptomyces sp. JJ66]|uniref:hypothetical protein n=1 Tax=Streptomyces sp. JJ66 TaxID=2803843 RepID=UPI001C592E6C|nr:hypothetical protein [Streptomyces sp. JJ66]MBW1603780.1 hypothetical protein [Streptomyces sp. JJ66]